MKAIETAVLDVLRENARMSSKDIAGLLNTTEKQVNTIVLSLEKRGIILGYTTIINEEKVPSERLPIRALIEVKIQPQKSTGFDKIAERIFEYDNVIDHYLISGANDFLLVVEAKDLKEISTFVYEKLAALANVSSTTTHFVLKKFKEKGVVCHGDSKQLRPPVLA